ncbi:hypothetical protein ES332_A12G166200v1 [Gossypium tomentosum]|uniref:Phorbol-ester/DAG-type domain-containing protein n=1 Tax=Gossypium tomentosum TaxID=34277 RepID=A0A5D2MYB1_GOSTO|nr:hypothetical protein ES332_A12G166200v1 [Gossypium tomentosum]
MEIKLASHEHSMGYHCLDDETDDNWCEKCTEKICGAAYPCVSCELWLHELCAKAIQYLPREITHPLHSHHHLMLDWSGPAAPFTCDLCLKISSGTNYRCCRCPFELDLVCAFASSDDHVARKKRQRSNADREKQIMQHYCHIHPLILYKHSNEGEHDYNCRWCDKPLTGIFYGCKSCGFFLHEFCSDKIPKTLNHPFHPSHPLRLDFVDATCNACTQWIGTSKDFSTAAYGCQICNFNLDFGCAKLLPTLKHESHNHCLTYVGPTFRDPIHKYHFQCSSFRELCLDTFYRCVQCDLNLHLKCVPVPPLAKHRYHRHPLLLNQPVREDEIGEYYCDICEKERDPTHEVYYCQKCTYIAHIECVLNQEETSTKQDSSSSPPIFMDAKASELKEMEQTETILVRPVLHKHPLKFCEVTENLGERVCGACRLELSRPGYICKGCLYILHENCAKLPDEIQHPLHPQHHLNLYATTPSLDQNICNKFQDFYFGFTYLCEQCDLKLDLKCATRASSESGRTTLKESERETELFHFTHKHKLLLCNITDPVVEGRCNLCRLQIFGYHMKCKYLFIPNTLLTLSYTRYGGCHACSLKLLPSGYHNSYNYGCKDCGVNYHIACAISLTRPLKRDSHMHHLYYFGTDFDRFFAMYSDFIDIYAGLFCSHCGEICSGQSFYRCLECFINFHVECVSLPQIIKSKCHIHPLTLKDSYIEDDSEEHYCDACEERRHPNHHVYYCEECAHIDCALSKEEEVVSFLVPRERMKRMSLTRGI